MGIATSNGVIRDFAGSYHVSEDNMSFGKPTKYWQLNYTKAKGGVQGWDSAVTEASEIYKTRRVSAAACVCKRFYIHSPQMLVFFTASMQRQLSFSCSYSIESNVVQ